MSNEKTPITMDTLLAYGMERVEDDPFVLLSKTIMPATEDLPAIKIKISNTLMGGFGICLTNPMGGLFWLSDKIDCIEALQAFEDAFAGFEPPF